MKIRTKIALGAVAVAGAAFGPARRRGRSCRRWTSRRFRYLHGSVQGGRYRLTRRHPDPTVSDDVLADRVRSQLGPVIKRLDIPHVHVMVTGHVVTLHGDVATAEDAYAVEEKVASIAGVKGVISLLHEGLLRSDTRPSEGAEQQHSEAFRRLLLAARDAGCREHAERAAVRLVLAGFLEHLHERDRAHLVSHLPADVKLLALPPRRTGLALTCLRDNMDTFVDAVAKLDSVPVEAAHDVVVATLRTLRDLVPNEARDIEGSLPIELRDVWDAVPHVGPEDD